MRLLILTLFSVASVFRRSQVFNITGLMTANLLLFGTIGVNLLYNPIMFSLWIDVYVQWAAALLAFVVFRHVEHRLFYLGAAAVSFLQLVSFGFRGVVVAICSQIFFQLSSDEWTSTINTLWIIQLCITSLFSVRLLLLLLSLLAARKFLTRFDKVHHAFALLLSLGPQAQEIETGLKNKKQTLVSSHTNKNYL